MWFWGKLRTSDSLLESVSQSLPLSSPLSIQPSSWSHVVIKCKKETLEVIWLNSPSLQIMTLRSTEESEMPRVTQIAQGPWKVDDTQVIIVIKFYNLWIRQEKDIISYDKNFRKQISENCVPCSKARANTKHCLVLTNCNINLWARPVTTEEGGTSYNANQETDQAGLASLHSLPSLRGEGRRLWGDNRPILKQSMADPQGPPSTPISCG